MKRAFCVTLMMLLLCGALIPAAGADGALAEVYCEAQDFSTKYPADAQAGWEEGNGLRIWLNGPGYVPNVLIWRRAPEKKFNNPVNYLNNVYREHMEEQYNNDVGTNPCQQVEMGGKTVYLARYHYKANGNSLCMTRVIEIREAGDVEYAAKYPENDPDAALAALENAVRYYGEGSNAGASPQGTGQRVGATTPYADGRFHVDLPEGWRITTAGEYAEFTFKAWDPANPNRTIFFLMKLEPFLKGAGAKAQYTRVANSLGKGNMYEWFADAPAMENCTLEAFLNVIPEAYTYADKYYSMGLMVSPSVLPQIKNPRFVKRVPSSIPAPDTCKDNTIAAITFEDYLGQPCEGVVTAQPVDMMSYDFGGVDGAPYSVYLFMGFTAPRGELNDLAPTLGYCLNSFGFEESYVKKAIDFSNDQKDALLAIGEYMSAAHTAMVEAWLAR